MSKAKKQSRAIDGSKEAKRRASIVLEVLGGLRTTTEACEAIGVTLAHYYNLENKAIEGLVAAMERSTLKGGERGPRPETQIARLTEERDRLQRELQRTQALVRVAQRAVGVPSATKQRKEHDAKRKAAGKKRGRKPQVRARRAIARLRAGEAAPAPKKTAPSPEPEKRRA